MDRTELLFRLAELGTHLGTIAIMAMGALGFHVAMKRRMVLEFLARIFRRVTRPIRSWAVAPLERLREDAQTAKTHPEVLGITAALWPDTWLHRFARRWRLWDKLDLPLWKCPRCMVTMWGTGCALLTGWDFALIPWLCYVPAAVGMQELFQHPSTKKQRRKACRT